MGPWARCYSERPTDPVSPAPTSQRGILLTVSGGVGGGLAPHFPQHKHLQLEVHKVCLCPLRGMGFPP